MPDSFRIYDLDDVEFVDVLDEACPLSKRRELLQKNHVAYFSGDSSSESENDLGYLHSLGVKTIVLERGYRDRDYLEDFAAYYVRCFEPYPSTCVRLHFFAEKFSADDLKTTLEGHGSITEERLQEAYAGFMVVKPIPCAEIGRTCIRAYPAGGRRHFPLQKCVKVSLFGINLTVECVPFQQQDNVTAACATSALWSAFQISGTNFNHRIPSPVTITKSATALMPIRSRSLPNVGGLTVSQMAHAVREVGLEPLLINCEDEDGLRATVYSYLHAKIPAVVIFELHEKGEDGKWSKFGDHAATVTGYSLPNSGSPAAWRHQRIEKLYVNDDGVGPSARMEFGKHGKTSDSDVGAEDPPGVFLSTSWQRGGGEVRARVRYVLIPTLHKIRIPYSVVLEEVGEWLAALQEVGRGIPSLYGMEWDLHLTDVRRVKADIRKRAQDCEASQKLLQMEMPLHLWRAQARSSDGLEVELLFDATGVARGHVLVADYLKSPIVRTVFDMFERDGPDQPGTAGQIARLLGRRLGRKESSAPQD